MNVILASASPRRKELLSNIFPDFQCIPSDIEEVIPEETPLFEVPCILATQKAEYVAKTHPDSLVIGSDTVVIAGNELLGKPCDDDDARRMLTDLSGKVHYVVTGCALFYNGKSRVFRDETKVEFYPLSDEEIENYIASREPFDKAGAYGIQGLGSLFVKGIDGDFFNVVGLPVSRLNREIKNFLAEEML